MAGTYSSIHFHIIFSTKLRAPLVTPDLRDRLHPFIGGIIRSENSTPLIINGMPDHLHILVRTPTTIAPADLVRHIKSQSSQWVTATFGADRQFKWQDGYAIFAVNESIRERVATYIANQEEHHRTQTYQEEFIAHLNVNKIDYDPRYVWD